MSYSNSHIPRYQQQPNKIEGKKEVNVPYNTYLTHKPKRKENVQYTNDMHPHDPRR